MKVYQISLHCLYLTEFYYFVIKILQNQSNTNQLEHENVINISWGTWKLAPLIIKKKK